MRCKVRNASENPGMIYDRMLTAVILQPGEEQVIDFSPEAVAKLRLGTGPLKLIDEEPISGEQLIGGDPREPEVA
jgi:hypothetical protein